MTNEEAIVYWEGLRRTFHDHMEKEENPFGKKHYQTSIEAIDAALSALRPVSREQVEKMWRGEWVHTHSSDNFWTEVWKCSHCDFEDNYGECFDFCPFCGAAQTDEAVDMVMERMEKLYEQTSN